LWPLLCNLIFVAIDFLFFLCFTISNAINTLWRRKITLFFQSGNNKPFLFL